MTDGKKSSFKTWCDKARELVGGRRDKGRDLGKARAQLKDSYAAVQRLLMELQMLNGARATGLVDALVDAGALVTAAQTAEDEASFASLRTALAALTEKFQAALADQKALDKKLAVFDAEFVRLQSKLAGAGGQRDALRVGSEVHRSLEAARTLHSQAQAARRSAALLEPGASIDTAITGLAAVVGKLAEVQALATAADARAEGYLKAMAGWADLKPKVSAAVHQLAALPGAEAEHRVLLGKYNEALAAVRQVDGVWQGHDEALRHVALYEGVLRVGQETSEKHLALKMPKVVTDAVRLVLAELERCRDVAPVAVIRGHRDRLLAEQESGRARPAEAVAALTALAGEIRTGVDALVVAKREAEAAVTRYRAALAALEAAKVPAPLFAVLRTNGDMVVARDIAEMSWQGAAARLGTINERLAAVEAGFASHGARWEALRAKLAAMRADAVGLVRFPVLATPAMAVRDQVSDVQKWFATGDALAAAIAAFDAAKVGSAGLVEAHAALMAAAREKKVPLEKPEQLVAYVPQLARAGEEVYAAAQRTRGELRAWLDRQAGLPVDTRAMLMEDWSGKVTAVWTAWLDFRQTAGGDIGVVNTASRGLIDDLGKLQARLTALGTVALRAEVAELAGRKAAADARAAPAQVAERIRQAKQAGIDVRAEEAALRDGSRDYRDILVAVAALEKAAAARQDRRRREVDANITALIDLPLKELKVSDSYRVELKQQSTDIRWMLGSGDPELVEVAAAMQKEMAGRLNDIADSGDAYAVNKKTMDRLAAFIGGFITELPETHRRLETRLNELRVASRRVAPAVTTDDLASFEKEEVTAASTALRLRLADVKRYREVKTRVRDKWSLVEEAGKAPQFGAYVEARIADAKKTRLSEGGVDGARNMLLALEQKLDSVLDTPAAENRKERLKALNAHEMHQQRQVVDMARQYQQEVAVFLDTVLPVAAAVTRGAEDGDSAMVRSLQDVVATAGKLVDPYLSNLTFFQLGSAPSPDMGRMKSDFDRARAMLADAGRTARRLIETPASTNVDGPAMGEQAVAGLARLRNRWIERSSAFDRAVGEVAAAVRTAAVGEPEALAQAAAAAALTIEGLRGLFRADAFATSFSDLETLPPKDASAKQAFRKRQLAAREAALVVMRQCHANLQNPLLRKLVDASANPFEPAAMKVAAAGVSTVLKEIQLQALASA